jgi:hypothetical protein
MLAPRFLLARCSGVIMPSSNDAADTQTVLIFAVSAYRNFESAGSPFLDIFCRKLIGLAKISSVRCDQFSRDIQDALLNWTIDILHHGPLPRMPHDEVDTHHVLLEMRRSANYLFEQLRKAAKDPLSFEVVLAAIHHSLLLSGSKFSMDDVIDAIGLIKCVFNLAVDARRHIKNYPSLGTLVYRLELAAQRSGGKLTAHRKNGAKGSLLEALDWLRAEILTRAADKPHWAECLPSEGQHPIPDYERVLRNARKMIQNNPAESRRISAGLFKSL